MKTARISALVAACGILSTFCLAQAPHQVAIGPWRFVNGDRTSRTMVYDTIGKILDHHVFNVITQDSVDHHFGSTFDGRRPSLAELAQNAAALQANDAVFGKASWHTRSIWVGTGPKTISTATIELFVYSAKKGTITYQQKGTGRSDEKELVLKDLADVIVTPFVTVVSGGPATPQEQRAVQIAIGRAFRPWVRQHSQTR